MRTSAGGPSTARTKGTGVKRLSVSLSKLAYEALTASEVSAPVQMDRALRCYVQDRGGDRPAWPYPDFLRGSEAQGDVRVELEIDLDLLQNFAKEAARQGVSTEQLAEHAAFYFAAELDAGRVTERILGSTEPETTENQ